MKTTFGTSAPGREDLKKSLRKNSLLIGFLLLLALPLSLHAEPLDFDVQWPAGASWQLIATYRQINGNWSAPVTWNFKVSAAESNRNFLVSVTRDTFPAAQLFFDRSTGQLTRVVWEDMVKGKKLVRKVNFQGPSPAYPLFSIIPFHTPVFARGTSFSQLTYHLKRQVNDRDLGAEELQQSIYAINAREFLSVLPDAAGKEWMDVDLPPNGFRVEVKKRGTSVFKQFWFPGFPWALYTETRDQKVWLAR